MPYSTQIVSRARARLAQAKADKESLYQRNLYEAYQRVPRLKEIDLELRKSMALIAQTVFNKDPEREATVEQISRQTRRCRKSGRRWSRQISRRGIWMMLLFAPTAAVTVISAAPCVLACRNCAGRNSN